MKQKSKVYHKHTVAAIWHARRKEQRTPSFTVFIIITINHAFHISAAYSLCSHCGAKCVNKRTIIHHTAFVFIYDVQPQGFYNWGVCVIYPLPYSIRRPNFSLVAKQAKRLYFQTITSNANETRNERNKSHSTRKSFSTQIQYWNCCISSCHYISSPKFHSSPSKHQDKMDFSKRLMCRRASELWAFAFASTHMNY